MENKYELKKPYELCSPIEFVLVGIVGQQRAVIAKSQEAKVDLVSYAQDKNRKYKRKGIIKFLPFITPNKIQLEPFSVDTKPTKHLNNINYDNRSSEFTFVWRGASSHKDVNNIKNELEDRVHDIAFSINENSVAQLEWSISPVIDQCNQAKNSFISKQLSLVYAFWFTAFIYIGTATAVLINKFL